MDEDNLNDSYYQIDNFNIYYHKKCPDFTIPKKKCDTCKKLINFNLFSKNKNDCNKCFKTTNKSNY